MYTKPILGQELKKRLSDPVDHFKIVRWASDIRASHLGEYSEEMQTILESLDSMALDPKLRYSKEELEHIADMLINNEDNILQKIDNFNTWFILSAAEERKKPCPYTKQRLGKELKERLFDPIDQIAIAEWAETEIYNKYKHQLSGEMYDIVQTLCVMSNDPPTFYLSKEQLSYLANLLINNENDIPRRIEYFQCIKLTIGLELKKNLEESISQVIFWAEGLFQEREEFQLSTEIVEILERLRKMRLDAYTEEELQYLAHLLIFNEDDVLDKLDKYQLEKKVK